MPNSSTGRPRLASTMRDDFVAISVSKLSSLSSRVSISCAVRKWTLDDRHRCVGMHHPPSGTASMSEPFEPSPGEPHQEVVGEQLPAGVAPMAAQRVDVGSVTRAVVIHSTNGASPAAMQ